MPVCNDQKLYVKVSPDQKLLLTCLLGAVGAAELVPHLENILIIFCENIMKNILKIL